MTVGRRFVASAQPRAAASAETAPARSAGLPARWRAGALSLLCLVAAFACYLRLASTRPVDSDGASQALQAWDMLHGNVLLHGWWLSDVAFYTTELPQYVFVELVRGLNADVVHVAAAMTYTLVVLLAALLAKGTAAGRAAVARVLITVGIMLAPQLVSGVKTLIASPDHIGTSVPLLVVWLILDRARPSWYVPVATSLLLGWAAVADPLVLYIGVLPLALVCAFRVGRAVLRERRPWRSQGYNLALGGGALLAGGAAELALHVIRVAGGFDVHPPVTKVIHSAGVLPHSLNVAGQGLLELAGANFFGLGLSAQAVLAFLHLVGVVLIVLAFGLAARRFLRGLDLVEQVLITAVAVNLVAYVFSTQSGSVLSTREIAAVLPFTAVLAGRMLADRVLAVRLAPAFLLVVLAGYLAGLGYGLAQPAEPPQNQRLASWLEAHHLHSGLAGFWQSNVVSLATGDRVRVRQLTMVGRRLAPYRWESDAAWYDPKHQTANFVVFSPATAEYSGFTDKPAVVAAFGLPAHVYHVGSYTVMVWNKNLLADLS
jgi:hypothetical protein